MAAREERRPLAGNRWELLVQRLLRSPNPKDREHLLLGWADTHLVLLPLDLLYHHCHITGRSGGGKSALLASLIAQLLRRGEINLVVLDFKGDMAQLWGTLLEASRAGYRVKWFTPSPFCSSYVFQPNTQAIQQLLNLPEQTQSYLDSFGMDVSNHPQIAFFGAMNQTAFQNIHATFRWENFSELFAIFDDPASYPGAKSDWLHARHVASFFNRLGFVYPMNVTAADLGGSTRPLEAQIDVADLLLNPRRCAYFYLPALLDNTGAIIGKLFLYLLLAAASRLGRRRTRRVVVVVDESQILFGENIAKVIEMARGFGIALLLAHQSMAQLKLPSVDLTGIVAQTCSVQIVLDAADPDSIRYLQATAGERLQRIASWQQPYRPGMDFNAKRALHPSAGLGGPIGNSEVPLLNVQQSWGPALNPRDILPVSADPQGGFVRFLHNRGYACYDAAWVPLRFEFHISPEEFKDREKRDWPPPNEETVVNPLLTPHQQRVAQGKELEPPCSNVPPGVVSKAFAEQLQRALDDANPRGRSSRRES
jgi:hypothetical protein